MWRIFYTVRLLLRLLRHAVQRRGKKEPRVKSRCINVKMIGYRGSDGRSATEGRTDKVMCRGRLSSTNAACIMADYVGLFDVCSTISFYVFN